MFIQDLFKEENNQLKIAYNVELPPKKEDTLNFYENIDDYSNPPQNLEFVGFILDLDEEGEIAEELLDIILSFKLTNLQVAIEAPSHLVSVEEEDGKISINSLLLLSANLDCSLSFLPPGHPTVDPTYTIEEYTKLMRGLTKATLNKPNHSQLIMPVANYQEYLMLEQILGAAHDKVKNFTPTDDYITQHFTPYLTVEDQNLFKAAIKQTLIEHYGGEEAFKEIVRLMIDGIKQKSKDFLKNHILNYIESQKNNSEQMPNKASE